jgi:hypothetical protein
LDDPEKSPSFEDLTEDLPGLDELFGSIQHAGAQTKMAEPTTSAGSTMHTRLKAKKAGGKGRAKRTELERLLA